MSTHPAAAARPRPARWPGLLLPIFVILLVAAASVALPSSGVVLAAPGLDISKSSSADVVESGEIFDYRILVSCSSSTGDCVDAQVVDVLPPELSGAAGDVFSNVRPVAATAAFGMNALKSVRGGVANNGLPVIYREGDADRSRPGRRRPRRFRRRSDRRPERAHRAPDGQRRPQLGRRRVLAVRRSSRQAARGRG